MGLLDNFEETSPDETRIDTIVSNAHPEVVFYDASKRLVGDRWQVTLIVRMRVPITEDLGDLPAPIDQVRRRLGETVKFEHKASRAFVAQSEKEEMLRQMCEGFKSLSLPYLFHADFQKKLVAKRYLEVLAKDFSPDSG